MFAMATKLFLSVFFIELSLLKIHFQLLGLPARIIFFQGEKVFNKLSKV
jgi:hypothetical protein